MRVLLTASIALLVASCSAVSPTTLEIHDIKVGLADPVTRRIYLEADFVQYVENGMCTVAGEQLPCMYWGYSYSYQSAKAGMVMDCVTLLSRPTTLVTPTRRYPGKTSRTEAKIILPDQRGEKFEIGYHARSPENQGQLTLDRTCAVAGRTVLNMRFTTQFPHEDGDVANDGSDKE